MLTEKRKFGIFNEQLAKKVVEICRIKKVSKKTKKVVDKIKNV